MAFRLTFTAVLFLCQLCFCVFLFWFCQTKQAPGEKRQGERDRWNKCYCFDGKEEDKRVRESTSGFCWFLFTYAKDSYRGGRGVRLWLVLESCRSIHTNGVFCSFLILPLMYIFVSLYLKWRQTFPARSMQSMFVASTSKNYLLQEDSPLLLICPYSNPLLRAQPPVQSSPQPNQTFLFCIAPGEHFKSA